MHISASHDPPSWAGRTWSQLTSRTQTAANVPLPSYAGKPKGANYWNQIGTGRKRLAGSARERRATALRLTARRRKWRIYEADTIEDRGSLVQVNAYGDDVAITRPLRVPDVRTAASGVLGRAVAVHTARGAIAMRNTGPKRLGNRN